MYPTILELGPITLHSYGLMIALGFLTVLYFMQRDATRCGIDPAAIGDTAFWVLILGIAGTRFTHIILYPQYYSWTDPIGWINVTKGGLVFQGAIPVAVIYAYWALKRKGVNFWVAADIAAPYVPLAQAFGRVGCFLKGCCHGARADELPWGVCFPPGSPAYIAQHASFADFPADAAHSFPVHPTQLYSVLLLLGICGILLYVRKRRTFIGICMPLYLMLYGVKRFIVEIYRRDGNPTQTFLGAELTTQQWVSIIMFIAGAILLFFLYRYRDRKSPVTFP